MTDRTATAALGLHPLGAAARFGVRPGCIVPDRQRREVPHIGHPLVVAIAKRW